MMVVEDLSTKQRDQRRVLSTGETTCNKEAALPHGRRQGRGGQSFPAAAADMLRAAMPARPQSARTPPPEAPASAPDAPGPVPAMSSTCQKRSA